MDPILGSLPGGRGFNAVNNVLHELNDMLAAMADRSAAMADMADRLNRLNDSLVGICERLEAHNRGTHLDAVLPPVIVQEAAPTPKRARL